MAWLNCPANKAVISKVLFMAFADDIYINPIGIAAYAENLSNLTHLASLKLQIFQKK